MPDREAQVSVSCNNPLLKKVLLESSLHRDLKFSSHELTSRSYALFLIDLSQDLNSVSQKLIDLYSQCRETNSKLIVTLLHTDSVTTEKNLYFQKMLEDLGKNDPLHRLVITKDLYQYQQSSPVTYFDHHLNTVIRSNNIDISRRGKNYFFPLSLQDYIAALAKIFFFTGTSGKTFWLLGDPLTDLEIAYLLKTSLRNRNSNVLEINALKKDDPQSQLLIDYSTKTKAELNWETGDDFSDALKKIINHNQEDTIEEIIQPPSISPLNKILHYFSRRHTTPTPKTKFTFKSLFLKFITIILGLYLSIGLIFFASTGISLIQLERSSQQILNGQLNQSVGSLQTSIKFRSIGESSFSFFNPIINFLTPNSAQKIANSFSLVDYSQTTLSNIQQTYTLAENLLASLNNPATSVNYSDMGLALHSNLSQIYVNLNQITVLSRDDHLPGFVSQKLRNNATFVHLQTLEDQIVQFIKISDVFPYFLSHDRAQNILVLFQNYNLLRPSGGNPEYYLLLTLDRGNLISQKVYSVSEVEALYQSTPSANLKNPKNAPLEKSSLTNLNIDSDFSRYSATVSSYIENSLKFKPDFIIAINNAVFDLLLSEDKSSLADSFKQSLADVGTSPVYREQIMSYTDRLFNRQLTLPVLGRTLASIIDTGQIYLWAADPAIETIFASQSYSGIITWHPCHTGISVGNSCLSQTAYLSEDQRGLTLPNPWTSRTVRHTVTLKNDSTIHEYQIDYTAISATSSAVVTSLYHLYLSSPSVLDQVYLDDLPYSLKLLTKDTVNKLDHYLLPLEMSVGKNHSVKFHLVTPDTISLTEASSYSLTEYRQPGVQDSGLSLRINYPDDLRVTLLSQPVTSQPSSVELTLPLHTSTFGLGFARNKQ